MEHAPSPIRSVSCTAAVVDIASTSTENGSRAPLWPHSGGMEDGRPGTRPTEHRSTHRQGAARGTTQRRNSGTRCGVDRIYMSGSGSSNSQWALGGRRRRCLRRVATPRGALRIPLRERGTVCLHVTSRTPRRRSKEVHLKGPRRALRLLAQPIHAVIAIPPPSSTTRHLHHSSEISTV